MGYIFEQEIEAIKNAVRARTIGEEETIRLRHVLGANIHPSVKAYCKAEVEKLLAHERASEMRSKRLPYALPEVGRLQHQIDLLLVHYYEFDKTEFESLLDESVHFQFNYLCRPQWTLLNFVFGSNRRVAVAEIEKKLLYCVDYVYFPDVLKRYFIDKGLAELEYEEFKSLLQKIDGEVIAQHSNLELAMMTRALFAFMAAGKASAPDQFEEPKLPINAAIVFFEDKQLEDLQRRLEQERDANHVNELSVMELAQMIEQVRKRETEVSVDEPSDGQGNERVTTQIAEKIETRSLREAGADPGGTTPSAVIESSEAKSVPARPSPAVSEPSAPATPPPAVESTAVKRVHDLFSAADKKVYLKSLFHKDEESFASALDYLDGLTSWDEASHFLDSLFVANNVDPFSVIAVTFTDRIFAKFAPPKKVL